MAKAIYKASVLASLMILFFVPMMGQTTAPTSITGTTTICSGSSTTLTASGGTLDANAVNVWYRGGYGGDAYDNGLDDITAISESIQSTINNYDNGILNLTSTGTDPQFYMRSLGSFDPSIYKYINVRYRVTAGTAYNMQVFFLKASIPNAAGDAYVPSGALNSDGNWHTISIDMSSSANWTSGGNITGWRFDWSVASGVTMDIDFIQLGTGIILDDAASITVSPATNTTYYLNRKGPAVSTSSISQLVTVNTLPTPTFTTQPGATACASTDVTYTTESGQTNYVWTLPGTLGTDYSITSGGIGTSSNTVTLKWLTAGSKTVTINYTNSNGCTAPTATSSTATTVSAPTLGTYSSTTVIAGQNASITPTAAPTNATSIVAYTSTNFSGTLTVNPTTGVVSVNNAKQAGTYLVTVKAFSSAGCTSTTTFTLTVVSNANCTQGNFSGTTEISVGSAPTSVAIGDFNGDGKQDFAAANYSSATVSIRLGDGAGGFIGSTNVGVGTNPRAVAIGDFNGDGKQDIAAPNEGSATVSICLGDGTGGFSGSTNVGVGASPYSVAIGDFNGDGKQDFAAANYGSTTVSIRLGDGAGGFSGTTNVDFGSNPGTLAIGDFNGDGKQDIAAVNYNNNTPATVSIRLGDGAGGFSGSTNVSVVSQPWSLAIGDFNGDGNQDFAATNSGSTTVSIRLGNGAGGFSGTTEVSIGTSPTPPVGVAIGDFNGDGKQDIATTNYNAASVSIRLGDGTGGFSGTTDVSVGANPGSIAIGDFNGDGKHDIAVANGGSTTVSIRLGAGGATFTAQPGATACPGTDVTYTTQSGQTNYVWTVPGTLNTDYTITSGGIGSTDNTVTLKWLTSGSKTVTINYANSIGCTAATATSSTATTVYEYPVFLTQPLSSAQSICSGASSLNVEVDPGSGTVASYKWYSNASALNSGGSLLITNTTTSSTNSYSPTSSAYYYVTATNSNGCVDTSTVSGLVTITTAPSISGQPSASTQSLCINGTPTNLSVTASAGSGTISTYKWYSNTSNSTNGGTLISTTVGSLTTNSYTPSTAVAGTTYYYCVVTNSNGCSTTSSVSGAITVVTASVGGTATAASTSVASGGTTTLNLSGHSGSIQWQESANGSSWSNVSGGTSAPYTTAAISATKYYRAAVTNGTCTVAYSNTLTIVLYGITTVTSFSPESGTTGSTITITGTNFSSTYSNNIVYFGATKATVNSGTTTSLNVTVPIGASYKPITVLNTDTKLIGASARPFRVTFTGAISSTMFDTRYDITHNEQQYRIGLGDFNNDGLADLAVPGNNTGNVAVFKNQSTNGSLSFAARSNFGTTGTNQNDLTVADFDGDGKLDMVSASKTAAGNMYIQINNTSGSSISFTNQITITTGQAQDAPGIAVDDFDRDGKMDIVVASGYSQIKVYRNTSTTSAVSFTSSPVSLTTGSFVYSISTADLNGDNYPEILTANSDGNSVSVFRNTTTAIGTPSFDTKIDFTTGGSPRWVAVGDMDGDNKVDIVTPNYNSTSSVFLNQISSSSSAFTSSSFAGKVDLTAPVECNGVAINDLDGDGKMDIALVRTGGTPGRGISIIKNNSTAGSLSFGSKFDFAGNSGFTQFNVHIADFDGDGRSDVATGGWGGVSIFRYGCTSPTISSHPSTSAQNLCLNGYPTSLSITAAAGVGTITGYQWYSNTNNSNSGGTLIAGASSSSYTPSASAAGSLYYYCIVTNSSGCTKASNVSGLVTVSAVSVSGTITGAGTVTSGTNSTILTLSGYTGTIQWQSSTDNISYSNIGSATSATYTATNLTATTFYKVVVTNGVCAAASSSPATITVASASTAFGITGSSTANTMSNNVATVVDPNIVVTANGTVSGFTVTITSDYTDGDVLGYTGSLPTGVNASVFNTTSRSINFTGTASAADWQTLLRTVTLTSTSNCYPTNRKVSFLPSNKYYNYFNGHYYEYISTPSSWTAAKSAAASRSFYGRKGYLVTVSSEAENNYIWKLISQNSWIGLSAVHTEINSALGYTKFGSTTYGQFYWVTGPEKGTAVSNGLTGSLAAVSGVYNNWASGEPNNYKGWGENSGHMFANSGKWNDFRAEGANNGREPIPYIVEYGGSQGDDESATISFTRDIIISGSPAGTISGADTVCNGTNSTTLTYSGGGTIQNWEYSTDNFATTGTTVPSSTASTLTATNLSSSRYYRAVVNTAGCTNLASSSALITVATSTAGSITAISADVCAGGSAAWTLNGNSGDIQKWQVSTSADFTTGVTDISNTTNSLSYTLSSNGTYYFRAGVLNSACTGGTEVYTEGYPVTVTTGTAPVGGTVNSVAYCGGSNDGTLTLSGSTGTSFQWEVSTDGGVVYTNASSTSTTQSYTSISTTTKYRVLVTNGSCGSVYSSVGTITIGGTSGAQWTGGTSTDWGNTANWCGYIIGDDGLDVTISATATFAPTLDRDRTIGNLNFNSSGLSVTLGNYTLTASSITGASSSNYIKTTGTGKLKVSIGVGTTTSLPVGNTAYNPVSITNNNSTSDYFSVKVLDEVYANSVSGSLNNSGRVQRTWDITKTNANSGSGVDFVFNWNAGETTSFTTASLYNYTGGTWVGQTGTTSSTSTSLTYRGYTGTMSSFAILSGFTWTGLAGDSLWNTAGNWSTGTAPLATTNIVISSGTPKLNVDYAVGGTLAISGTGALIINPGKTLSISSGGVADFGGKSVTIKSDVTGTGQLGRIQGTLRGDSNVTVERYIPATGRRYRMLTPSVNTSGSIKANWMEGNINISGTNVNTVAGYGTQITGPGGNANGFDVTATNAASLYLTSNGVSPGYTSVSNTTASLSALTGYFLFIRGNRSMNMNLFNTNVAPNPIPLPSSATTLRATGTIVQGTVNSFTNALSSAAGGFSLVTNPYPAAIDWASVHAASTNLNNYFSYWDPNMGFRGGFVTVRTDGVNSSATSLATNVIQSGQAFFVTTTANGTPTISIQESHKVGNAANNIHGIFKANTIVDDIVSTKVKGISPVWENYQPNLQPTLSTIPEFRISLYYTEDGGDKRLTDGAVALFDNQYTSALDGNDAIDAPNWDENIAISRNGQNLAIESRAQLTENDTLAISMSAMKVMNYEMQFQGSNFGSTLLQPFLIDNYLKTLTPLSLTTSTTVPFTVTSDTATSSKNRFKVVFKTSVVLPFTVTKITATKKNETVQVDWEVKTDEELKSFEVERSSDGRNFVKLATVASLGKGIALANYSWVDNNPLMGENFYRINVVPQVGKQRVSPVAMATFDKNSPTMVVYPNPTEGNDFSIKLSNLTKGIYQIIVTSLSGQQVLVKSIEHPGGMNTERIVFGNDISKGVYRIQVKGEGLSLLSNIIKN